MPERTLSRLPVLLMTCFVISAAPLHQVPVFLDHRRVPHDHCHSFSFICS